MNGVVELTAVTVGVLLLAASLTRAGASPWTWWQFRWRMARLLTALLLLALIGTVLVHLAGETVPGR